MTVVDGNGNSLRGLTAANFELFDDGVKRPVTAIEAVDFAARALTAGAALGRWLSSAAPVVTGLPSRFARAVAVLRREHTRDTLRQWLHATTDALSGVPPPGVSPPVLEDSGEGPSPSSRHAA